MRKRKILFTSRQFSPCIGGTETFLLEICRGLVQSDYEVTVLAMNRNIFTKEKLIAEEVIEGIQVYRVPYLDLKLRPIALCSPFWLMSLFFKQDLIVNSDIRFLFEFCLLVKWVLNKPLAVVSHGYILHQASLLWLKKIIFHFYYLPLFRFVDVLHAVSEQDAEKVRKGLKQIVIITNGVNTKRFKQISTEKKISGSLFYFGRLDGHKGVDLALEMLVHLPKHHLRVAFGSKTAGLLESLQKLAEKLKVSDRVEWLGRLEDEQISLELNRAEIVVFPSRYEGYGITTVEAMSVGAIVLANDIDAFRNLIKVEKNGFLVDFTNSELAATKIQEIAGKSKEELNQVRLQASEYAANQDWEFRVRQIKTLYDGMIETKVLLPMVESKEF